MISTRIIDSMSDGMCGYVELEHPESGLTARVRWSISSDINSQSQAIDVANAEILAEAVRLGFVRDRSDEVEEFDPTTGLFSDESDDVLEDPYFDNHTFSGPY